MEKHTFLSKQIEELKLPSLFSNEKSWKERRAEIIDILCREEYGFLPEAPLSVKAEVLSEDPKFCAGKANLIKYSLECRLEKEVFSFPVYAVIPKDTSKKYPSLLHINFRDSVPDKYMPSEELFDNGYAVFSFCYKDVTSDDGDFSTGLSGIFYKGRERKSDDPGKIAFWAWGAMRAMDFIQTLEFVDKDKIAVAGHSRLGKTALLTGALDERFACAMSNNSGCSGAALSRERVTGRERIADINRQFPYWFCENYKNHQHDEENLPFDQHFLLALIAPRKVYVSSAEEDLWADPISEYLACFAASSVYEPLGLEGFICPDRFPRTGDSLHEGNIGYHLRDGAHYFSRKDWNELINFLNWI